MPFSENSSPSESMTGRQSIPTTDDKARELRNAPDYDDWEYGTEPIPGDHNWISK